MRLIIILIMCFILTSCSNSPKSWDCVKVKISESDFKKVRFTSIPLPVKSAIIELAINNKKMDTAFSLDKEVSYSYKNPGSGKGYMEQVLKDKEMHTINGKCYDFLLYSMPYLIFDNKIYSLEQPLGFDCSTGHCQPDTSGINESYVYLLSLSKIY